MKRLLIVCACLLMIAAAIQAYNTVTSDGMVEVSVQYPEHGRLLIEPPIPADGRVAPGSRFNIRAEADQGYFVDSVFQTVSGQWWPVYEESMAGEKTVTVTEDTVVGALTLPESVRDGITEMHDVSYAKPGVKVLQYDVFSPQAAVALPIVAIIHGGGWVSNTEDIMRGMARQIARTGRYVAISLDYRWAEFGDGDVTANSMADIIGDVFGALAHIQQHASEYGADPQRIAVTGDSAGGHLSAVAATMVDKLGERGFGQTPGVFEFYPSYLPEGKTVDLLRDSLLNAIKAAAPSYGVFSDKRYFFAKLEHFSANSQADDSWAAAVAPIHHVPHISTRAVPHYLLRGTDDPLIRKTMVDDYADMLRNNGQTVRQVEVEGANHAFLDWKPDPGVIATFEEYAVPHINDMIGFFDEVFMSSAM